MPSTPESKKETKSKDEIELEHEITLDGNMRIQRLGKGMYACHSESRPETAYTVDVMSYDGLGSCQCDDFLYRRFPRWKSIRKNYDALRCKHIRRVRNHMMDQIIAHYAKQTQPH